MKSILIMAVLFLAACSMTSLKDNTSNQVSPTVENRTKTNTNTNSSHAVVTPVINPNLEVNKTDLGAVDPNKMFKDYSVYFDLDEYTVKEQFHALIQQHANYLVKHPGQHVFLEGHTDERGGTEYNLALGQRRSNAVRVLLQIYGVKDNQIEAYSYGSTKPRAAGSNEEAWAQNRRVDIYYKH